MAEGYEGDESQVKVLPLSTKSGDSGFLGLGDSEDLGIGISDNQDGMGLVTARGTGDGLVLRIDGRASGDSLIRAVRGFVSSRKSFLEGNSVAVEWVAGIPSDTVVSKITNILRDEFSVKISDSIIFDATQRKTTGRSSDSSSPNSLNLFSGMAGMDYSEPAPSSARSASVASGSNKLTSGFMAEADWDEPDARVIYSTLRSGQKIETEHTLIVVGDVNSGAELIAGGDIIVLGTLRGIAHAGAYDETGGGRFIMALNLQPTQLRIGVVISRGASQNSKQVAEIAKVEGNNIVVEAYVPRILRGRMTV